MVGRGCWRVVGREGGGGVGEWQGDGGGGVGEW